MLENVRMPRANRYLVDGQVYHLTQRCHDRQFLLRFARDRDHYRQWLRVAVRRSGVSVYDCCVTSNHVHLIVHAVESSQVAELMHLTDGVMARSYNRRKGRSGAFWEDQYQATAIETGEHLWNCLLYIELNMVRAGVVKHPSQWKWCGYAELMGLRQRYRILDIDGLLEALGPWDLPRFRKEYTERLAHRIAEDHRQREEQWTESLAVGSRAFVEGFRAQYGWRQRFELEPAAAGGSTGTDTWTLRESASAYGLVSGRGNPV